MTNIGKFDFGLVRTRMRLAKNVTGLSPALLVILMLSGQPGQAMAETVRWARSSDALTLDPHAQNSGPTNTLALHFYEPLIMRANDGSLAPRLATEWYILDSDPTVWEFKLRPGVKFHDGSALTARDVVFSLDRARAPTSGMSAFHSAVEEVRAVDDMTVQVRLAGPSPLYPQNLTNTFIMSESWSSEHNVTEPQDFASGADSYAVRNENGTGQYRLLSRDPGVRTEMALFEDHWAEEKPAVTEIVYTPITDDATRVAALLSGEVDLVQDLPIQDIERLSATPGIKVVSGAENRSVFFGYDIASPRLATSNVEDANPFADVRVRQAMDLAVDRVAIQRVVMRGNSDPSGTPVPPSANGWTEELNAFSAPDYDRARELMAEAGYADGFSVTLHCTNDRWVNDEAICQALVGMIGRIGIRANLVSQPLARHVPLIENWETDFYILSFGFPTFDAAFFLDRVIHSRNGPYGTYNGSRLEDSEIDTKIESLGTEVDFDRRDADIAHILQKMKDEYILLNIHNQLITYAMKEGINLEVHPENQPLLSAITLD